MRLAASPGIIFTIRKVRSTRAKRIAAICAAFPSRNLANGNLANRNLESGRPRVIMLRSLADADRTDIHHERSADGEADALAREQGVHAAKQRQDVHVLEQRELCLAPAGAAF